MYSGNAKRSPLGVNTNCLLLNIAHVIFSDIFATFFVCLPRMLPATPPSLLYVSGFSEVSPTQHYP